jgi:hypothetical protein
LYDIINNLVALSKMDEKCLKWSKSEKKNAKKCRIYEKSEICFIRGITINLSHSSSMGASGGNFLALWVVHVEPIGMTSVWSDTIFFSYFADCDKRAE